MSSRYEVVDTLEQVRAYIERFREQRHSVEHEIDGVVVKVDQRTLSALYHASLRAELTRSLAVIWHEPANGIAEMTAVPPSLLREFSQRSDAVAERFEEKLERFAHDMGYEPSPRQRWQLEREAVTDSRPAKGHADVDIEPAVTAPSP